MLHHFPSPDIGPFGRRVRHARAHRIPVTIANVIGTRLNRDTLVVVDAFGADEMPLGPCRCCTVRKKLQAALRQRLTEREQGRYFARVAIETDNDLGPILRTFATERVLAAEFYVEDMPAVGAHTSDTDRFVLHEDAPLSWDAFSRFMTSLMALRGADLLHAKGLLNVSDCRGPVVVEFVQHLAHRPVELQAWPDGERASRLAFVTRKLPETAIRTLFDAVKALSAP